MRPRSRCRIFRGRHQKRAQLEWAFPQPEPNPYQLEWDHLVDAIRQNQPFNEVKRGTEAGLAVALGRRVVHTGQIVTFEEMLQGTNEFAPGVDPLTANSPAPVQAGVDGRYPAPQPGRIKDREC